jgi:glycosyltransferase involved in cell wall biosynthesis
MPERPRILLMGPDPEIGGGMATALRGLLDSSLAERYRLEVDATYRGPERVGGLLLFAAALARLTLWSLRGRGRVVHVHATVRGSSYRKAICVVLAKALRRRVVLEMHSGAGDIANFAGSRGRFTLAALRRAFGMADRVLAVSAASAAALTRAYGLDDIAVIPNGAPPLVDVERSAPGPDDPIEVVYLGGFANAAKAGDVMLEAAAIALARESRLRVLLAGPGELPPAGADLIAGGAAIEWAGWLDAGRKDEVLREGRIFAMSSRSEGLPMALLEAMSYGLAIVATDVGGIGEVARSGQEALLVPAEDPEALAAALCALAEDGELRTRLVAAAREKAASLSGEEVADRIGAVYDSLL